MLQFFKIPLSHNITQMIPISFLIFAHWQPKTYERMCVHLSAQIILLSLSHFVFVIAVRTCIDNLCFNGSRKSSNSETESNIRPAQRKNENINRHQHFTANGSQDEKETKNTKTCVKAEQKTEVLQLRPPSSHTTSYHKECSTAQYSTEWK